MADSRAEHIFQLHSQMENDRSTLDAHCREIAERILPRQDNFQKVRQMEGEKRTEKIFDATAPLALDRAASAIDSLVTPATQQYHRLEPSDERLVDDREVKMFLEWLNKQLFRMRYRPTANYASQAHECYTSLMAFGTLGLFTDDELGVGTRYKSIPLSGMYIAENGSGIVDYVHRVMEISARAAVMKFKGHTLPPRIVQDADKHPFQKYKFLHCVKPNEERKRGKRDYTGMAFSSYYCSFEGRAMVSEGGFRTMPYAISRHVTAPNEVYGRSPAMLVLPDIKMVNEMEKTIIRAGHKIVDPPLLLYGDGILSAFSSRPNAMNYGGVDEQGRQLVHPMKMGSNLPIAFEMTEQKRKVINDAFYVTLFQILVQNPQMTATEALIRAQEKGQLLAPTIGRQQSEFLGSQMERELDILAASGALNSYPGGIPKQLLDSGGLIKIVYTSPLSRLRRAEDGVAIMRTLEFGERLAAAGRPEVMDNFEVDDAFREMADINGAPAKLIVAPEVRDARRKARATAEASARQAEQSVQASVVAKNAAQAAATAPALNGQEQEQQPAQATA